jgi:hypothetical protein
MINILRTEKGGYDKSETFTKLEEYTMLLVQIQKGLSKDEAFDKMKEIKAKPLSRVKEGFFSKQGFSVEDTDNYISELENQIIDALSNGDM